VWSGDERVSRAGARWRERFTVAEPVKKKMSQTMRINLITDAPAAPAEGHTKRVVVTEQERKAGADAGLGFSPGDSSYQQLLHSLYDAALIGDESGSILDANVRAVEFFGYPHAELVRTRIGDLISGADDDLMRMLIENLRDERFTLIQAYCSRKNGTFFPSEIAVSKLNVEGGRALCFYVRDITLRRQADEMLRTEHSAIQNAGNGIAVANVAAELEYVNPAVLRMWGFFDADAVVGQNVHILIEDRGKAETMLHEVLDGGGWWEGETRAKRPNGETFDLQISATCNRNSEGEVTGVIFSFADISDRKRAQEAEREAERQRVMIESLGAACHHLGQPATILLANLGVMQEKVDKSDPTVRELVQMSTEAAEALGAILHKLNEVSEYKTTQYLSGREGDLGEPESRILDIG
jgi:PAS domain S-box-containing protein